MSGVMRRFLGVVVVAGISVVGCSELVDPKQDAALQYRFPSEGEFVALAGHGPCLDGQCNTEFDPVVSG